MMFSTTSPQFSVRVPGVPTGPDRRAHRSSVPPTADFHPLPTTDGISVRPAGRDTRGRQGHLVRSLDLSAYADTSAIPRPSISPVHRPGLWSRGPVHTGSRPTKSTRTTTANTWGQLVKLRASPFCEALSPAFLGNKRARGACLNPLKFRAAWAPQARPRSRGTSVQQSPFLTLQNQ